MTSTIGKSGGKQSLHSPLNHQVEADDEVIARHFGQNANDLKEPQELTADRCWLHASLLTGILNAFLVIHQSNQSRNHLQLNACDAHMIDGTNWTKLHL
ncbi:hypothetical protein OAF09_01080 [bacterium]|nr:hypothetical protein [bacterium]